jgi:membrane peptidoglycan carboxypeptidase
MTKADGRSLFRWGDGQPPADQIGSFTLGAVYVAPMSMAAAYATVAARGRYCHPVLISSISSHAGQPLTVESAHCRQVIPKAWADAANYILQGVLTGGTAVGRGIGRPAAAKTGTSDGGYYAAFGGFTPTLAGYVSVFNPLNPTGAGAMINSNANYREIGGGLATPGQMFGANAPGATWQLTFLHANLGPPLSFVGVPTNSPFFSQGSGIIAPNPPKKKPPKGPGGSPTPTPSPSH